MTTPRPDVKITISCSVCGLESPFRGCDRDGCEWRADYIRNAIAAGTPVTIEVAEPTPGDRADRRTHVTLTLGGRRDR